MTKKQTFFKRSLSLVLALVAMLTSIPATHAFAMQSDTENQQSFFRGDIATTILENEIVTMTSEDESTFNGCWAITYKAIPVYDTRYCVNRSGSLFLREGFTILTFGGDYLYVEYSTSTGTKRGYLDYGTDAGVAMQTSYSSVGKMNSTANVYYGTDTSIFRQVGAVYAGETVAILAKNSYWAYIEYNTTAGRKRGYVYANTVQSYNTPGSGTWGTLYTLRTPETWYIEGNNTIYAGPGENYAQVGSVSNENVIARGRIILTGDLEAWYVEYDTSSGKKSGFILTWL